MSDEDEDDDLVEPTPPVPQPAPQPNTKTPEELLLALVRGQKRTRDDVKQLATDVKEFVERDTREHAEMREAMATDVRQTSQRIETIRDDVNNLAVQTAAVNGTVAGVNTTLGVLVTDIGNIKKVEAVKTTTTIETEGKIKVLTVEDQVDARKSRRAFQLKVLGILGVFVTAMAALIQQCQ